MHQRSIFYLLGFSVILSPLVQIPIGAQENDSNRIDELEEQVESLQSELQELKKKEETADDTDEGSGPLGDALSFESKDGVFTGKIGGRLMIDYVFTDLDDSLQTPVENQSGSDATDSAADFRRARLFAAGSYGEVGYKLQVDFEDGTSSDIKDAYLDFPSIIPGGYSIKVGRFYEPWGLEGQTSSKYITFMEFALPVSTFYAFRTNGIGAWGTALDERIHWGTSFTRSVTDSSGNSQGEGEYAGSARLTGLPYVDDEANRLFHTGVSLTSRSVDNQVNFDGGPELTEIASFADTGSFTADRQNVGNVEAVLMLDSFSLQGEYVQNWVDSDTQNDPTFNGYYAYATYYLTGEHRNYNKKTGKFGRPNVKRPVFESGYGAWELIGRYSTLDLDDEGLNGGDVSNITLGTNWWLNSHMKIALNYVHSDVDGGVNGANGDANMVGTRFQIDF